MSYKAALEYTQEALAEHELTQISDTCWKFAKPGTFNMGFFVAWAPGHLFFGGDIDTVTTVHYQAMSTPEGAASWVLNSSFDYWASKTGVEKIYDEDGYTYPQRMVQQHYALKQWAFAYLHTTQIPGVRTPTIEKGWP